MKIIHLIIKLQNIIYNPLSKLSKYLKEGEWVQDDGMGVFASKPEAYVRGLRYVLE